MFSMLQVRTTTNSHYTSQSISVRFRTLPSRSSCHCHLTQKKIITKKEKRKQKTEPIYSFLPISTFFVLDFVHSLQRKNGKMACASFSTLWGPPVHTQCSHHFLHGCLHRSDDHDHLCTLLVMS